MTPEALKAQARRLADEVLTQGDLNVADEIVTSDCRYYPSASFSPGHGGIKRWVASLRRAFPDLSASVEEEIAEGETVVQRMTLRGTHQGVFLGFSPTGQRVDWPVMSILHASPSGTFVDVRIIFDRLELMAQLGATPDATRPGEKAGEELEECE